MKALFGAVIVKGSGKLGGHAVSGSRSGSVLKTKKNPINRNSNAQGQVRSNLAAVSATWRNLSESQRTGWEAFSQQVPQTNDFGTTVFLSGFGIFCKCNQSRIALGYSILLSSPGTWSSLALTSLSAWASTVDDSLTLVFAPVVPATHKLKVFASRPGSAGISESYHQFYFIGSLSVTDSSPYNIGALYVAKFGTIGNLGQKIFVKVVPFEIATGLESQPFITNTGVFSINIYNPGTLKESFDTIGDWAASGTGCTVEASSSRKQGFSALKINVTAGVMGYAYKTVAWNLSAVNNFVFWVYITDVTKVSSIQFWFTSNSGGGDRYSAIVVGLSESWNGWNRIVIAKSRFAQTGAGDWANIIRYRVYLVPVSGQTTSIVIDDLLTDYIARPKILLSFDDGDESIYVKAYPILAATSIKPTLFLIGNRIDVGGSLTQVQIDALNALGWVIANHTWTHEDLTSLSPSAMHATIDQMTAYLKAHGYTGYKYLAYPSNVWNQTVIDYCKATGITICRTGYKNDKVPQLNFEGNIPYQVFSASLSNTITLADVQGYLTNTIAQNGILSLHGHQIVDSGADIATKILTATFQSIITYIQSQITAGVVDAETFAQYENHYIL